MILVREIFRFIRLHWVHLVILPIMAIVITVIHELAHAVPVWVQGGKVLEFTWLPSLQHWGMVRYEFPLETSYSSFAISIGPYVVWLIVASTTFLIGLMRPTLPFWLASTLFVWCFVIPLADIATAAFPYLLGGNTDFYHAFGSPTAALWIGVAVMTIVGATAGYPLQQRLYGEKRLPLVAYGILTSTCLLGIVLIACCL